MAVTMVSRQNRAKCMAVTVRRVLGMSGAGSAMAGLRGTVRAMTTRERFAPRAERPRSELVTNNPRHNQRDSAPRGDAHASRGPRRPSGVAEQERFSEDEIATARNSIARAFELGGFVNEQGQAICPQCGKTGSGRVKLFPDGGYKCFSAQGCVGRKGGAVDLLVEKADYRFFDAVAALIGRPLRDGRAAPKRPTVALVEGEDGFRAECDPEVYEALMSHGNVVSAQRYYGRFHIDPEVVAQSGAVIIADCETAQRDLMTRFGAERLAASGLYRPAEADRREYWVVNENYPVIEPHYNLEGRVVGLQARPSLKREGRYRAHVAYSKAKKVAEAAGESFREPAANERYVPKFLSLRGGQAGVHLQGCGLERLLGFEVGEKVYIVEGFKDLLAMRTLGFAAYALPGTGVVPSAAVIDTLARFNLTMAFDADEGGDSGTQRLVDVLGRGGIFDEETAARLGTDEAAIIAHLATLGLDEAEQTRVARFAKRRGELGLWLRRKRPPEGMDVTDVLVDRHAGEGCDCVSCIAWRLARREQTPVG